MLARIQLLRSQQRLGWSCYAHPEAMTSLRREVVLKLTESRQFLLSFNRYNRYNQKIFSKCILILNYYLDFCLYSTETSTLI
jgi:hypothetical protein